MVDLSLHILDVATNAFKAKATLVKIIIEEKEEFIQVSIEDDGCGMSDEVLQQVTNPFFTSRTTRKVGLEFLFLSKLANKQVDISILFLRLVWEPVLLLVCIQIVLMQFL